MIIIGAGLFDIWNTSARGSVSQFGDVNVNPLSVPASIGKAWYSNNITFVKINDNLCVEGWYEESIFTEAHTVEANEPVGRRDDLRDHRYLGDHCQDHDLD